MYISYLRNITDTIIQSPAFIGVIIGIPFLFPILWPVSGISLSLFFLHIITTKKKWLHVFSYSWVVSSFFMSVPLFPIFDVYPLSTYWNLSDGQGLFYITTVWIITSIALGIPTACWALATRTLYTKGLALVATTIATAFLWVGMEHFRSMLFSSLYVSEHGSLYAEFSFGFLGYLLANTPFAWFAHFGGVYILSFIFVFLSTLITLFLVKQKSLRFQVWLIMSILFIFVASLAVGGPRSSIQDMHSLQQIDGVAIAPLSTTSLLGQETIQGKTRRTQDLSSQIQHIISLNSDPIVFVLPENSDFINRISLLTKEEQTQLQANLSKRDIVIVDSGPELESDGLYVNTIRFWTPEDGIVSRGYKRDIVPFGEYMPLLFKHLFVFLGSNEEIIETERPHRPSAAGAATYAFHGISLSALSCSEIYNPTSYYSLRGNDLFINVASYAMFHGVDKEHLLIWPQIMAMAKVHALWANKPYVQASNDAPSFLIFPSW